MTFSPRPEIYLETERLIFIKQTEEHVAFQKFLLTDEEVARFIPKLNEAQVNSILERQKKHWEDHNFGSCIVCLKGSEEKIGSAGLKFYPPAGLNVADIGCFLLTQYQRKGFGFEILSALVKHGFDFHGFEKISAITSGKNIPSIKLAEKIGFKVIKNDFEFEQDGIRFTGYVQLMITKK